MKYNNNDYFNNTDDFLIKTNWGEYVTKCEWYNGNWYSLAGLRFKMTSVLSRRLETKNN